MTHLTKTCLSDEKVNKNMLIRWKSEQRHAYQMKKWTKTCLSHEKFNRGEKRDVVTRWEMVTGVRVVVVRWGMVTGESERELVKRWEVVTGVWGRHGYEIRICNRDEKKDNSYEVKHRNRGERKRPGYEVKNCNSGERNSETWLWGEKL